MPAPLAHGRDGAASKGPDDAAVDAAVDAMPLPGVVDMEAPRADQDRDRVADADPHTNRDCFTNRDADQYTGYRWYPGRGVA